jgi:N-acetylglucosamine malate deacetylase 1
MDRSDHMARSRVIVIAAHPDDETLGVGGTIARHAANGDEVHIIFLTDGIGARGANKAAARRRATAARTASEILGGRPPRFLGFSDNRLDAVPLLDVAQAIEKIIAEVQPDTIYTHHAGDLNVDHEICQRAVLIACRPLPGSTVRRIFAFEVVSSTEWSAPESRAFSPIRFVDISRTIATKRRALEAYAEEMRPFPHPRSLEGIDALARHRGASAGLAAAEAFGILREIEV